MKRNKILITLLVFLMLVISNNAYCQEVGNNFIVIKTIQYGEQVIQISAPLSYANKLGTIQLYNSNQKLVKEVKNVELIKSPYYTTISVEDLSAGIYQIKISLDSLVYSQSISINK
jgi:hypothetical protein